MSSGAKTISLGWPSMDSGLDDFNRDFDPRGFPRAGDGDMCGSEQIARLHFATPVQADMHSERQSPIRLDIWDGDFEFDLPIGFESDILEPVLRGDCGRGVGQRDVPDLDDDLIRFDRRGVGRQDDFACDISHRAPSPFSRQSSSPAK